jgi:hypothetical protein
MMTVVTMVDASERTLVEGSHVEVRNRFDGRWTRGFLVHEVLDDGYRIRRTSDDQLLPSVFSVDEVRREHRRGQWWY